MTSTHMRLISAATAILIVVCGGRCFADFIAYNNFGVNPIYQSVGTWQGSSGLDEAMQAQRFTANLGGQLTKIETGMRFNSPGQGLSFASNVDRLTFSLVPDDNGKPGTQELWSQNYGGNVPTVFGAIASFNVLAGPTLVPGSKYWLISRSTSIGSTPHVWWLANPPANEPYAYYYLRGATIPTGEWVVNRGPSTSPRGNERALRVSVMIPEPTAAALMLAASATLLTVRRCTAING